MKRTVIVLAVLGTALLLGPAAQPAPTRSLAQRTTKAC